MRAVHFVGIKGDSFAQAVKVWGQPDFWHKWHDHRMWQEVDKDVDVVVFDQRQDPNVPSKWSWDASAEN